jgi:hypothetical protein
MVLQVGKKEGSIYKEVHVQSMYLYIEYYI